MRSSPEDGQALGHRLRWDKSMMDTSSDGYHSSILVERFGSGWLSALRVSLSASRWWPWFEKKNCRCP